MWRHINQVAISWIRFMIPPWIGFDEIKAPFSEVPV